MKLRDLAMDADRYDGRSFPNKLDISKISSDDVMNQAISQLEAAFELGLAGLREYLSQLAPEDREKVILTISDSIRKY
jgi:hypothetical protein